MPTQHLSDRVRWLALFVALAAVLVLSWTVFPAWGPQVPTIAVFVAAVLASILIARTVARKALRWSGIAFAVCLGLVAALLLIFQLAIARVPEYRVELERWISEKTKLSIEFSTLSAQFRLYGPELAFIDVTVRSPDRTRVLATARRGSVAFDIWNSLRTGRLTAGRFTLDSPQLGFIRTRDGRIQIAGQSAPLETKPFAIEHLPVGQFRVRDALVTFEDETTGRGPWSFSAVNFMVNREPELLELQGDGSLPSALGQKLDFSARVAGPLETPQRAVSTFSIEGKHLDLTGWAEMLPDRWPAPDSGRGALRITAKFLGAHLQNVIAQVDFANVTSAVPTWMLPLPTAEPLRPPPAHATEAHEPAASEAAAAIPLTENPARNDSVERTLLSYQRVHVDGRLEREGEGWHAHISALDFDAPKEPSGKKSVDWHSRGLEARWSAKEGGAVSVAAKADVVVLQSISPLLAYLPESESLARVRALQARGTLRDLAFSLRRADAEGAWQYEFSAAVDDLGVDPVLKTPGVTGLSGLVQASETGGEFRIDSGPMYVSLPWMFRWPFDTESLRGVLTWRDAGDAWNIASEQLHFEAADGKGEAKLGLRLPKDGSSPHLDISAQARDMNAASTPKYLPANLLAPEALEWLDRAFVSGRVPRGELELHGPTHDFPFRGGEGEFVVRGFVQDLTFDYQPGWTPAMHMTGNVEFRNEGMHASGITAHIGELTVTDASGGFADFRTGELKLAASATGDLSAALGYLQTSPIAEALGDQFAALRGRGVIHSTVSLLLPIAHIEDRRIAVATKLVDATVRLSDLDAPVTQLNGSLIVRQTLPVEADLNGQWLGGPVEVVITPEDRSDTAAMLVAQGHASAERMSAFLPPSVKVNGAMDWRLTTRLTAGSESEKQVFAIDSQLLGLGIDLPYPAGKRADESRAFRVELESGDQQLLARASLGSLRGLLLFQQSRGNWAFDRGGLRADGIAAALPGHPGLRLEGSIDRLPLDDWFALRSRQPAANENDKVADVLRAANLHVGLLQLYGYEWPDVRGVMQATPQGWRVDVTGSNAEGQIVVPEDFTGAQPLTVNLERLIVLRSDQRAEAATRRPEQHDPLEWPSLRVHIGDMHVENHPIGGVDLIATRVADGLRIDSLTIAQDAVQAEASGAWLVGPGGEHSNLTAKITSTDMRATLRALNYTEFMDAKRAEISAKLSWAGGFDDDLIKHASGTITVAAESGQLLMLQPGAGRVLGLFSVAALPRRLSLDFSDLTDKGLSFDTIHGDFELRDGNAYTNNLLLRGPAAEIGVAGRTGLATQDYDQTAVVTGNLGASIPVAGALAGGPAVGAALLLFSQVFKEPLKGIARGYYRITGSWNEPVVERVDAAEAKESTAAKPRAEG